ARIRRLGLDLRIELARALARHQYLDAGRLLDRGDHGPAPLLLHSAIDDELSLGGGGQRRRKRKRGYDRAKPMKHAHDSSSIQPVVEIPITAESLAQSAALVAMSGLPAASPSPAKNSLVKPPASRTSTMPAAQSHALMCSSQYASTAPAATSARPSAPEPARRMAAPAFSTLPSRAT